MPKYFFVKDKHIPYNAKKTNNIYYSDLFEAHIIDYYRNKSFPLNGWIKECIICDSPTGKFVKKNHFFVKNIIIPLCKHCQKKKYKYKIYEFLGKIKKKNIIV